MAAKKKAAKKSTSERKAGVAMSYARKLIVQDRTEANRSTKATAALDGAVDARSFLEALDGPLTFRGHLRALRQGEELSLESFAKKLGVTRTYLSDIELGRRSVSVPRAAEWARLLGYSPEQFVRLALQAELDEAGLELEVTVSPRRPARASTRKGHLSRTAPAHAG